MNALFSCCYFLSSLPDISKWCTNKVINMNGMFNNCFSLVSLPNIDKWDISNVTNSINYSSLIPSDPLKSDTNDITNFWGIVFSFLNINNININEQDNVDVKKDMLYNNLSLIYMPNQ